MKKLMFLAAGFTALLMTACGAEEKKDGEKKEEKKEVSEETKSKFDALKAKFSEIDGMVSQMTAYFDNYPIDKQKATLDSLKGVAEKAKKEIKEQALPLLDTLLMFNVQVSAWKATADTEVSTWGNVTEDFTGVITAIEKGEGSDEEVASRAEGFTNQFNYKAESIKAINDQWAKMAKMMDDLKTLLNPAK